MVEEDAAVQTTAEYLKRISINVDQQCRKEARKLGPHLPATPGSALHTRKQQTALHSPKSNTATSLRLHREGSERYIRGATPTSTTQGPQHPPVTDMHQCGQACHSGKTDSGAWAKQEWHRRIAGAALALFSQWWQQRRRGTPPTATLSAGNDRHRNPA